MKTDIFNAPDVLSEIREQRATRRRRSFRRSRLARYRSELVELRTHGASYHELAAWLRGKRVKVSHTTIIRYLAKLPELQGVPHAELSQRQIAG